MDRRASATVIAGLACGLAGDVGGGGLPCDRSALTLGVGHAFVQNLRGDHLPVDSPPDLLTQGKRRERPMASSFTTVLAPASGSGARQQAARRAACSGARHPEPSSLRCLLSWRADRDRDPAGRPAPAPGAAVDTIKIAASGACRMAAASLIWPSRCGLALRRGLCRAQAMRDSVLAAPVRAPTNRADIHGSLPCTPL